MRRARKPKAVEGWAARVEATGAERERLNRHWLSLVKQHWPDFPFESTNDEGQHGAILTELCNRIWAEERERIVRLLKDAEEGYRALAANARMSGLGTNTDSAMHGYVAGVLSEQVAALRASPGPSDATMRGSGNDPRPT